MLSGGWSFFSPWFWKWSHGFLISPEKKVVDDLTWKEAPRFRLHACWCRFASVHGYRGRRRRGAGDQSDQTRTRPVFWSTKVPLSFFVMLRQSIGAFGAVVFFQGKPKPMGFFLTNKKTTIQQQIYIQLGPGKVLACWSLPFPPLQNGQVCLYCGVTPMESLRILILRSSSP